jgi:pyruvate kinase
VPGDVTICGTTHKGLPADVRPGDPILVDDGKVALRVTDVVGGTDVVTLVEFPVG